MELSKMIGCGIVILGILFLVILSIKRRKIKKRETEEQNRKAEEEERASLERKKKRDEFLEKLDFRREGPPPKPASILDETRERSMILCYNTVYLTDVDHPSRVYRADLFQPAYVGRSRENEICIREESVSRRHMRIFRNGAFVYAENLNNINGTLLNGKLLTRPREIVTGSRLKLGRVELKVEID